MKQKYCIYTLEVTENIFANIIFFIPDRTVSFVPVPKVILYPPVLVTQDYTAVQKHLKPNFSISDNFKQVQLKGHPYFLKCKQLFLIYLISELCA